MLPIEHLSIALSAELIPPHAISFASVLSAKYDWALMEAS